KFNTFIAMFLIISEIYLFLFRTHVNIENERNNYRNQLKDQNVLDVNNKEYNYQTGVHYMDIISECEKLGDYVVNVVEARTDIKEKKIDL
ncbi:Na/Pi cotransporter family protein, partial [Phocaeicola vulgatus]|nr:Na/Pi cotransporter family protein [Phocaeicola vulgatus]MDB0858359.1 Na/Pi cotransporter family protein [Phocaeicola vulgatus]MDB0866926.1 Na/Pi cotransporter family protein [Phocaeicola vulgatus]MDB0871096.1 Na/Pi cotransporter family protein [Phocaeicola vulgatus]MDB0884036.1 Na/Pi cotransporter family protein [Phocaeicola vulgatus]